MTASVTLINTNVIEPLVAPIGLDYIAGALESGGHTVELVDLALVDGDWRDAIRSHFSHGSPRVVGITFRNTDDCYLASGRSFVPHLRSVVNETRAATDAPIVLGGAGFSVMPEAVLEATEVDIGVWGEGELSFGPLADRLLAGDRFDDIPNLVFRDGVRRGGGTDAAERGDGWRRTPKAHAPLGILPARTRTFIDNRRYFDLGGQGGIETKRGCSESCVYCADPVAKGRTQRLRPPRAVVDEVEALLAQDIDCLHVCDSEFNLPERHARAICDEIVARGLGDKLAWYAYCSPAPFSTGLAKLMRQAGCVGIDFGADSGSDAQLKRLGRRHRAADLAATAEACRVAGIVFMYDLLLGGPGETRETVAETIGLMKRIEPHRVGVSVGVRVYPNTPLAGSVEALDPIDARRVPHGVATEKAGFLDPVFYVSEHFGDDIWPIVSDLICGDPRFFFSDPTRPEQNYNYNDNELLASAIADGYRGAYWDILRRLFDGG